MRKNHSEDESEALRDRRLRAARHGKTQLGSTSPSAETETSPRTGELPSAFHEDEETKENDGDDGAVLSVEAVARALQQLTWLAV